MNNNIINVFLFSFFFSSWHLQSSSANPLHSSSIALNSQITLASTSSGPLSSSTSALASMPMPTNAAHSPKSPCQLSIHALSQSSSIGGQQPQQSSSSHLSGSTSTVTGSSSGGGGSGSGGSGTGTGPTTNLMSTSLNSSQLPSHLNQTASASNALSTATSLNVHSSTTNHVPSMSTSLHSASGVSLTTGFDSAGTSWNSTSSLSPTISASAQQRKLEVKLNAMP